MSNSVHPTHKPQAETSHGARAPRWRRYAFVGVAGVAALIGLGSVAAVATELETEPGSDPALTMSARTPDADCGIDTTLTIGRKSAEAKATALDQADETANYGSHTIAFERDDNRVSVGATVDDDVFLTLRADAEREDEVVDLMEDMIDQQGSLFDNDVDLVMTFSGEACDLTSISGDDSSFEDFFHQDATVEFDTDDGECQVSSLFAAGAESDFELKDLHEFDLDFDFNDGGFAINLDTGDGTLGLRCNSNN